MSKPTHTQKAAPTLRERAEAVLQKTRAQTENLSPRQIQKLLHELQAHQIELEMQNEELRLAQVELAETRDRLHDLFDHAPVGYVMLDEKAGILEANLTLANMLAVPRAQLLKQNFAQLVDRDSQDAFHLLRQQMFGGVKAISSELMLRRPDEVPLPAQLDCTAFVDPITHLPQCRMTVQDVTERRRAQMQLRVTSERMQLLSRRLVELQESERQNIARELHDEIGQALTVIQINLQKALAIPGISDVRAPVAESLQLVDSLVQQTQDLSLSLRPSLLDDLGLESALRWLAEWHAGRTGLKVEFAAEAVPRWIDSALATACFRVAQESLTNVVRHAAATAVAIHLWHEDGALGLMIEDNGRGFDCEAMRGDQQHKSLGLLGMEERVALAGGLLEVHSAAGKGTRIVARFPLRARTPES